MFHVKHRKEKPMGYKKILTTTHIDENLVDAFIKLNGSRIRKSVYNPRNRKYTFTVATYVKDYEYYLKTLCEMRDNPSDTTQEQAEAINYAISAIKTLQDMGVIK